MVFLFPNKENKKHKEKTKPPNNNKHKPKNTFLHVGKDPPIFGKSFLFFKLHSFISAKVCFAENTIKIVFAAEHSF